MKNYFIDVIKRLSAGLRHYKRNHIDSILNILKKNELFHGIAEQDVLNIYNDYSQKIK